MCPIGVRIGHHEGFDGGQRAKGLGVPGTDAACSGEPDSHRVLPVGDVALDTREADEAVRRPDPRVLLKSLVAPLERSIIGTRLS
ncbi:hypothetical protein GCM10029978_036720 [Actinoallomurus acanthiterrae]